MGLNARVLNLDDFAEVHFIHFLLCLVSKLSLLPFMLLLLGLNTQFCCITIKNANVTIVR